jgi:hypothetical protein
MMPAIHVSLIWPITIFAIVIATESLILVAILKRGHVKASGWLHKFGFQIEASDPGSETEPKQRSAAPDHNSLGG